MSWGYRILTGYLAFVTLIVSLVVMCMKQTDIHLVEKEYYREEINYQEKIEQLQQVAHLKSPLKVGQRDGALQITYPAQALPDSGRVWLFCPANAARDRYLPATANAAGLQQVATDGMARGLYRVKVSWVAQGRRYFGEESVVIP